MTDLIVERVPLSLEARLDVLFNGPKATKEELRALLLIRAVLAEGWRGGRVADLNALILWCRLLGRTGHPALSGGRLGLLSTGRPWRQEDADLLDEARAAGYRFAMSTDETSVTVVFTRPDAPLATLTEARLHTPAPPLPYRFTLGTDE